jgi:hypothetical protein
MRGRLLLGICLLSARAQAAACDDPAARLSFVSDRLHADARHARVWTWSWSAAYTGLAAGQIGLAQTRADAGERAQLYVGAGQSLLGLLPVLFVPVPALGDAGRLDARLAAAPAADERCALMPEAERLLARSADDEAFARSALAHALTVAVNAGGLLIVGLGYHRWAPAAGGALIGVAIGELTIFTRPAAALDARRSDGARFGVAPLFDAHAAGARLYAAFDL